MSTLSTPKASIPATATIAVFDLGLALEALPDQQPEQPQSPAGRRRGEENVVTLSAVAGVVGEEAACPFCMEGLEGDGAEGLVVKQGRCGHVFHDVCVSTWVSDCYGNDSCPLCRCKIV